VSKTKGAEELIQILKWPRQEEPVAYMAELCTYKWWEEPELVQWEKFNPTVEDKVIPNYQEDNQQYWDNIMAEIEDRIVQEESWIDEELP